MKAIIKTDNKNLFYSLLDFLKTISVTVETDEEKRVSTKKGNAKQKKFNPREYEGMLSNKKQKRFQ